MERQQKEQQIEAMRTDFDAAQGAVLVDFKGLNVRSTSEIRAAFRNEDVSLRVVKNTLARIATKGTKLEAIKDDFVGTTAIAYSAKDPVAPARIAEKCSEEHEFFVIKSGYVDGARIDASGVEQLAKLPSANELRAKLLGTLMAPATDLVRVFQAVPQKVVLLLSAQEQSLGEN
ncbi:MAG: 50S ribosomal protein L10 [Myxococcota bacterium]